MSLLLRTLLVGGALALGAGARAQGETIVVDDTPDVADFGGARRVANLPGPDGRVTFREAVIAASNTPGPQTILFRVPPERWGGPDRVYIESYIDPFIVAGDSTTIDGRSQTVFTGDTYPNGSEVAFDGVHPNGGNAAMILVRSRGNTFIGLGDMDNRRHGIEIYPGADGNRILGNTIWGPYQEAVAIYSDRNVVGGPSPDDRNVLQGVLIAADWASPRPVGNRVVGNHIRGVVVREATDTVVGGPTAAERNLINGVGKFGEEGFPSGTQLSVSRSTGTLVEGNYIGTDATGLAPGGQRGTRGVVVHDAPGTVLRNNVISGILIEGVNHAAGRLFGVGVELAGDNPGAVLVGNRIGVGADGQTPVPNLYGVEANYYGAVSSGVTVGGTAPGDGNVIAHNVRVGVRVWWITTELAVLGNAMFANGSLGIDLEGQGGIGPTENDPRDPDEGGNRLQNYPVIQAITPDADSLVVTYAVDTAPANASYPLRVEFFAADVEGQEGEVFLGADTYTEADYQAGQPGSRTVRLGAAAVPEGRLVVATATDAAGNTSEFGGGGVPGGGVVTTAPGAADEALELAVAPNPARGPAAVTLVLPAAGAATVAVYDALGRRVATLHDGPLAAGRHALVLDAAALAPGAYVLRVATGDGATATRRLIVAR